MPENPCTCRELQLQVAVDQVVLLQAAQALADLAGPYRADAFDRLELALRRLRDHFEPGQAGDDPFDDRVGQSRDVREHAIAPRRYRVIERVDRRREPEDREQLELEQLIVG